MDESNQSYIVQVNDFEFSFTKEELEAADLVKTGPGKFNLLHNQRSAEVAIAGDGADSKQLVAEVDGESFRVTIKDELDLMIEKMGFNSSSKKQIKEVLAPMPGMVLQIDVQEGQDLTTGEKVLTLEAMKMENSILVHADARVKKIHVKQGQAVDKGQVLIELE